MSVFKKVALVASAQLSLLRAPAALAFLAGVCESQQVDYVVYDLNSEFHQQHGADIWSKTIPYSQNNLDTLPKELDIAVDNLINDVVHKIVQSGCDAMAITVFSYMQNQWAERFLRACQQYAPNLTTIIGGPGVSSPYQVRGTTMTFGSWLAKHSIVDYYVLGEGDQVFADFLAGNFYAVGINNQQVINTWPTAIEDLDSVSNNSYRKIKLSNYCGPRNRQVITLNGSRGCVRRCTFCDVGAIWKKFKYRSGRSLADEMVQHWQQTGVTDFWFNDSLINGSIKQFMELLEAVDQYQTQYPELKKLTFSGQFIIRPQNSHSERMYKLMASTGCNHLAVGVESGSERVRTHMGKKFSNADIDYHLQMCEKYSITNFMLTLVGYPTETEQDFQDTLNMFTQYQRYIINRTILGISLKYTMTILPGTPIEAMQSDLGIEWVHGHNNSIEWRSDQNPSLTVNARYQRWVTLIEHATKLGYSLGEEALDDVAANHQRILSMQGFNFVTSKNHLVIPIQSAPAAILS